METGDKHRDVSDSLLQRRLRVTHTPKNFSEVHVFCEESLKKINEKDVELFRNGSVHESVDYFETRKYFRRRKKEDL